MRDLLDEAPCGFLSFADDGTILRANATLGRWLGWGPAELAGSHVEAVLGPGARVFYQTHFFPLLRLHGKAEEVYLTLRARDGGNLPVVAHAVRRAEAAPPQSHCVFVPVRQRSLFEDEILRQRRAAERAASELRARTERDRRIAAELQDALRPSLAAPPPGLDLGVCYRPALEEAEVGGDYFDVFGTEPGRTVLAVADLSGKGLAAATQTATVRNMFRALLYQPGVGPAEAARRLNEMLVAHRLISGFVTLFAARYDAADNTLAYVSCGHETALLWRAAEERVEEVEATGWVLGASEEATFEEAVLRLAPGDVLAAFTDGLTEARTGPGRFLRVAGVRSVFEAAVRGGGDAAGLADGLVAGVYAEAPVGVRDDVCLLVARVV